MAEDLRGMEDPRIAQIAYLLHTMASIRIQYQSSQKQGIAL